MTSELYRAGGRAMRKSNQAPPRARVNVLGVGIHAINLRTAVALIEQAVQSAARGYICVTGVHGVMEAQRDPEFRAILNRAMLVTPDGMPTVWVGRLQGYLHMQRVFGPDLMLEVCRRAEHNRIRHFLYGGKPGVAQELAATLKNTFPAISIAGAFTPPFRPLDPSEERVLEKILVTVNPDVIWVGLSTPKQERFMAAMCHRLPCKLMIGVGAAFDVHTGRLKDAPEWIKRSGLQWMHRLCQEPRRLWRRYLVNNSAFLAAMTLQLSGLRQYSLPSDPYELSFQELS